MPKKIIDSPRKGRVYSVRIDLGGAEVRLVLRYVGAEENGSVLVWSDEGATPARTVRCRRSRAEVSEGA